MQQASGMSITRQNSLTLQGVRYVNSETLACRQAIRLLIVYSLIIRIEPSAAEHVSFVSSLSCRLQLERFLFRLLITCSSSSVVSHRSSYGQTQSLVHCYICTISSADDQIAPAAPLIFAVAGIYYGNRGACRLSGFITLQRHLCNVNTALMWHSGNRICPKDVKIAKFRSLKNQKNNKPQLFDIRAYIRYTLVI